MSSFESASARRKSVMPLRLQSCHAAARYMHMVRCHAAQLISLLLYVSATCSVSLATTCLSCSYTASSVVLLCHTCYVLFMHTHTIATLRRSHEVSCCSSTVTWFVVVAGFIATGGLSFPLDNGGGRCFPCLQCCHAGHACSACWHGLPVQPACQPQQRHATRLCHLLMNDQFTKHMACYVCC